jgi:hypothetical protein
LVYLRGGFDATESPEITGAECPEQSECIQDRSSTEALAQRMEASLQRREHIATRAATAAA